MNIVIPPAVQQRALSRWHLESPTGCHVSEYSTGSHGYAQIGWHDKSIGRSRMVLCHRAAWAAIYGQIPDGMTVDHLCKNRMCVNVAHLRLLDNFENARRTHGRDWLLGECANGHPSDEYLRREPSGRLRCTACRSEYDRSYRNKRRNAA